MRYHRHPMPPCVLDLDIQEFYRGGLEGLPKSEVKAAAQRSGVTVDMLASLCGQEVYHLRLNY
jgi:hypothetical protein